MYSVQDWISSPSPQGWGYSGFQVTGMIEWGQKSKPNQILRASNKTPQKSLDQKLTPQKPHAKFLRLKNLQKALNDITRKIWTIEIECLCLFIHHNIWTYRFFEYPQKFPTLIKPPKKNDCQIFLPQKVSGAKMSNPKFLQSSPSLEIWSTTPLPFDFLNS